MAAPSKSFTSIPDADVDPDSPLTTGLLSALRDRDENLSSQLIGETSPFVAAQKHNHNGLNSAAIAFIFDQSTGNSTTFTSAAFVDLVTITVASADLPNNRDALIIGSGVLDLSSVGADTVAELRLEVAGVAKQTLPFNFDVTVAPVLTYGFAFSEIVNLLTGASRDIKIQGRRISGTSTLRISGTNLLSTLIT